MYKIYETAQETRDKPSWPHFIIFKIIFVSQSMTSVGTMIVE